MSELNTWEDADLNLNLLKGIYSMGFDQPSPIQKQSIYPIISGKDIIAQAQSGTGKTGSFCIGTLNTCDVANPVVQKLILAPTRELAAQIHAVFMRLGNQMGVRAQLLVGGNSTETDIQMMANTKPHAIIGTPGRVLDMMKRSAFNTNTITTIVLDEADEILSDGFMDQIYFIFKFLSTTCQVVLFSATLPESIENLTTKFMKDPVKILVKSDMLTLEGISQFYVPFDNDYDKYEALKDIYGTISVSQSIIYCNTVNRVKDLYMSMLNDNFPVCCIHSDMGKDERNSTYTDFKSGKFRVLVSSNLTARGIDVQQVSVVVNFDIPKCVHTYLHRIGRSGRWGRKGVGINFVTKLDSYKIKTIEQYYQIHIKELPQNYIDFI